jgi:hypothetical protein
MNYNYQSSDTFKYFVESPEPTVKHTSYFEVYDEIFKKFKNQKITFVEIGVLNGVLWVINNKENKREHQIYVYHTKTQIICDIR